MSVVGVSSSSFFLTPYVGNTRKHRACVRLARAIPGRTSGTSFSTLQTLFTLFYLSSIHSTLGFLLSSLFVEACNFFWDGSVWATGAGVGPW